MPIAARAWIRTMAVLVAAQLAFWGAISAAEWLARPTAASLPPEVELTLPGADGVFGTQDRLVRVPLSREPAYFFDDPVGAPVGRFRLPFHIDTMQGDLALYLGWMRRISEVSVNGHLIKAGFSAEAWSLLGNYEPATLVLPENYLHRGDNEILVTMKGKGRKVLPAFYIVTPQAAASALRWGQLFSVELPVAAIGTMFFALALLFAARWPEEDRQRARAAALLLTGWIAHNLAVLDFFDFVPGELQHLFVYSLTYMFLATVMNFALTWGGSPPRAKRALVLSLLTACAIEAVATLRGSMASFQVGFAIEAYATIAVGVLGAATVLRRQRRSQRPSATVTVLFLFCLTAVVVDAVDDRWWIAVPFAPELPLTFYFAPACGLVLALGLAAVIATQAARARALALSMNAELESRLAERSAALEASHARNREFERQMTLAEERQRIVRDMHDGIGGHLTAMLLTARIGDIKRQDLVDSLQTAMDDLRLIVHSMEVAGDTLEHALLRFRERVEPRLQQGGVCLQWQIDQQAAQVQLGPEAVLHVFRVLQECVSNAVRHGSATRIDISVACLASASQALQIRVADNGSGLTSTPSGAGSGLRSMRSRATRLGGTLHLEAGAGTGAVVTLTMPVPPR